MCLKWFRKKAPAASDEKVVSKEELLSEAHAEGEHVEELKSLLTDIRRFKDDVQLTDLPAKPRISSRKRKSSSRKRR